MRRAVRRNMANTEGEIFYIDIDLLRFEAPSRIAPPLQ